MATLALLRHGQSEWNLANLFTGWVDVDLSPQGEAEASAAGQRLRDAGLVPDLVHTSLQKRAIRTVELALKEMRIGNGDVPVTRSWRLNERHYGALQGLDKAETAAKYGDEQVKQWRRSYATRPPPITDDAWVAQRKEPLYAEVPDDALPHCESLEDVVARMLPYWHDHIAGDLREGRTVFVVAHGNSLRALVMHLDRLSEEEVLELNIPTGVPLVYELDADLSPTSSRYLSN
ncbi:MAG: 2,3-diphosphoglycerate-dependent phosphoglycerate mutase [Actinobacteria bacterium]|nr:2,3-diphosphoglycerate-dependent phosphoglycerate mutase [Actinomycetota bacterium]